jgi:hypothetical protein
MLDLIRKICGMVATVAGILAIVSAVLGGSATFGPLIDTFKGGWKWQETGAALNDLLTGRLGIPMIMVLIGLTAWSFDDAK